MKSITIKDLEYLVNCKSFKEFQDKVQAEAQEAMMEHHAEKWNHYCEISIYCGEIYITIDNYDNEPLSETVSANRVAGRKNVMVVDREGLIKLINRLNSVVPHLS